MDPPWSSGAFTMDLPWRCSGTTLSWIHLRMGATSPPHPLSPSVGKRRANAQRTANMPKSAYLRPVPPITSSGGLRPGILMRSFFVIGNPVTSLKESPWSVIAPILAKVQGNHTIMIQRIKWWSRSANQTKPWCSQTLQSHECGTV